MFFSNNCDQIELILFVIAQGNRTNKAWNNKTYDSELR